MSYHRKTSDAAHGQWRGILMHLGVPGAVLQSRHGPCPLCKDGKDRFRFDNKGGTGSYFCSVCGAGTGMDLAMKFTGMGFQACAARIDDILGNKTFEPDKPAPVISDQDRTRMLREAWAGTRPIEEGDGAWAYLASRGVADMLPAKMLRFAPRLRDGEGGFRPAMVALVGRHGEAKFDTMHRTFLLPDGSGKAEMPCPRKLMPGDFPEGASVMLSEYDPEAGGPLGIAEGIETAMSAALLCEIPVWAALTAGNLERWTPPPGCEEVVIFGDHDDSFTGQAAAYALARRLWALPRGDQPKIRVAVKIPERSGEDWNDVLRAKRPQGFRRPEPKPHAIAAE